MLKKVLIALFVIGIVVESINLLIFHNDGSANALIQSSEFYEIDPRFREFYQGLGGEPVLGRGISPKFYDDLGREYQYVVSALLVYDHKAPEGQRFRLASIGQELNIEEPAQPAPEDPTILFRNGHYIYGPFVQVFNDFGGPAVVGEPLADPIYDPARGITIQYFENLGFYRKENDSNTGVQLLYYGVWKCGSSCSYVPQNIEGNVDLYLNNEIGFEKTADDLPKKITGHQLTEVQKGSDGLYEQVFENLVLVADPLIPGKITLRPLTTILGYTHDPLQKPVSDPKSYFFPVRNGWGYQVRDVIIDTIEPYGGLDFTGFPISEMKEKKAGLMEQCFENVCIEYSPYAIFNKIRLEPLGREYYSRFYGTSDEARVFIPLILKNITKTQNNPVTTISTSQSSNDDLSIYTWTSQTLISSKDQQIIGIGVYQEGVPVPNVKVKVFVKMPDGKLADYSPKETKQDGRTFLALDPIDALNGTRIVYQACIIEDQKESGCTEEDFLIWGN